MTKEVVYPGVDMTMTGTIGAGMPALFGISPSSQAGREWSVFHRWDYR